MLEVLPVRAFKDNYIWTLRNATHTVHYGAGKLRAPGATSNPVDAFAALCDWKSRV